jgi:hypothetical protein
MVENLKKTFSTCGTFDVDAIYCVLSRPLGPWQDNSFSEHEVTAAVRKMACGKSSGDSKCPADIHQPFFVANCIVGAARFGGGPLAMSPCGKLTDFSQGKFSNSLSSRSAL